jgi:hypothetical protein
MSDAICADPPEEPEVPNKNAYEVGYGRPPKAHQFKSGQSGNSKGRPRGSRGLKTDLKAELGERVTVNENGKQRRLTKQQLIVKQLVTKSIKGDLRAIVKLADLTLQIFGIEDDVPGGKAALAGEDEAIVNDFIRRLTGKTDNNEGEDEPDAL